MTDAQKPLSKNHLTERRFKPYSNASSYIKHLNNLYNLFEKANSPFHGYSSIKKLNKQSPIITDYKVSLLPRSHISRELEVKKDLLNKFTSLDKIRTEKNKNYARSATPVTKKPKYLMELSDLHEFRNLIHSILTEKGKKCEDCKKNVCECIEKTEDLFLKKMINYGVFRRKTRKVKENGVFLTSRLKKNNGLEMEIDKKQQVLCGFLEDGSLMTIRSAGRSEKKLRDCKSDKRVKRIDSNLTRALAITPVTLSEHRKLHGWQT